MARKYFEQMLLEELELGNYPGFQRWYMGPNPFYYSFCEMNQDIRNIPRFDRYDLYSFDYYRQPYWVNPQNLVFPNYEPFCLFRRNDKRGFHSKKYHFPRDKKSFGEKRTLHNRQEDNNSYRIERGKSSDFLSQVDRRYPPSWNHESQHYPITRDGRNTHCLSYRNSNMDLCAENIIMDQHLQSFKQMFGSRNSSTDCLPVNENLTQPAYNNEENVMHVDSPVNGFKTSDVEWKDQVSKVSKDNYPDGTQQTTSENFNNSYASWYCPEEQQQIIDMLKEVNLRHDRQLKRDMHLSRSEQTCSDESVSSNNESQVTEGFQKLSLSSEDSDDDGIIIHLSPGAAPLIPELATEDEDLKNAYHEKSASDFFEEFQNIFTGSPERKVINNMTKESLKKSPHIVDDDDLVSVGRVITEEDKNAVRAVLDFDHMDELTEKVGDNCSNISASSSKETPSECGDSSNNSEIQNTVISKVRNHDDANNDFSKNSSSNKDSTSLKRYHPDTYSCSDKVNPNHSPLEQQQLQQNASSCDLQEKSHASNSRDFQKRLTNFASNIEERSFQCSWTTSSKTRDYTNGSQKKKENGLDNVSHGPFSTQSRKVRFLKENSYNNIQDVENFNFNSSESECRSSADVIKYTVNESNTKIVNPDDVHEHMISNSRKNYRYADENKKDKKNCNVLESASFSNKEVKTKESGLSISEPFLSHKPHGTVYKRISLSEIFSSVSFEPQENLQKNSNKQQQLTHLPDQDLCLEKLSPTDHLKKILGIGENSKNKPGNAISVSTSEKKNQSHKTGFLEGSKLRNGSNKNEDFSTASQNLEQQKYACCRQINVSQKKNAVLCGDHSNTPIDTSRIHISKNQKSAEKISKPMKIKSPPEDSVSSAYVPPNEPHLPTNIRYPDSKHRSELKSSEIKLNNDNSLDKRETSAKKDSFKYDNQNSVPDINQMSDVNLKFKHNGNIDVHIKSHKSPQQVYQSNTSSTNENELIKSKKVPSNVTNLKNDKKKRMKEISSPIFPDDSHLSTNAGKDFDELPIFKFNAAKSKKKFKKKRKGKFIDESDICETKQNLSQSNGVEQSPQENPYQKDVSKSFNKYKKSKKKEIIDEISNPSTSVKCVKNFISNDKEKMYNDSTNESRKSYFKNSSDKVLNSFTKEHNSTYDSNLTPSDSKKHFAASFNSRKSRFTNEVTSHKLKDNPEKNKYYSKGYEIREDKSHWKNKIRCNDQYYPSEDKRENVSTRNCFKQSKEQQSYKNSMKVLPGNNFSKEFRNNTSYNDEMHTKNVELKSMQYSEKKECAKKISICQSAFSSSGKESNCPDVASSNNEPLNAIHQCESSSATSINKADRTSRPVKNTATDRSNFVDSSTENSAFRSTASNNKSKTQQMLDETEETRLFLERRKNESWKRQNHWNRRCTGSRNYISTEFLHDTKCNDSYYYAEQVRNNSHNNVLSNSMREFDLRDQEKLKHDVYSEFLHKYSYRNNCAKEKNGRKRISRLELPTSKEPKRNNTTEELVPFTPETSVLVITPKVMYKYLRSKQAQGLNHLLDVHVQTHISDLFSELKQSPDLEKCLQLSLSSVISKKLFHTLPMLLSLLSMLSTLDIPWSRNGLKKLLEMECQDNETKNLGLVKSRRGQKIQNHTNEILNCWDIISKHLTNEKRP